MSPLAHIIPDNEVKGRKKHLPTYHSSIQILLYRTHGPPCPLQRSGLFRIHAKLLVELKWDALSAQVNTCCCCSSSSPVLAGITVVVATEMPCCSGPSLQWWRKEEFADIFRPRAGLCFGHSCWTRLWVAGASDLSTSAVLPSCLSVCCSCS